MKNETTSKAQRIDITDGELVAFAVRVVFKR
jgi:hypothetical protein